MPEPPGQRSRPPVHCTCPCCGLLQELPPTSHGQGVFCARCETPLHHRLAAFRSNSRTAAIALAALILYPFAVTMPMIQVQQFGHAHESSILDGVAALLAHGDLLVGIIVLLCSIVLPLGKLLALLILSAGGLALPGPHRALTYRLVEGTGRWGMLDVLVVAVLVAVLKLGDMVDVQPGPAALAFACVVILSLLATATFDPHSLWEPEK
jgi:paraquat-inducible protein A